MGELAKKIGEYGEQQVLEFLEILGWYNPESAIDIPCSKPELHAYKKSDRKTHGIDFVMTYLNPLHQGQLTELVIEVKYSNDTYKSDFKKTFRKHHQQTAQNSDCYEVSKKRASTLEHFDYDHTRTYGILFWLTRPSGEFDRTIDSDIANCRLEESSSKFPVIVVTNQKHKFFKSVHHFMQRQGYQRYDYYYPQTGKNINQQERLFYGKLLPCELLSSKIIIYRCEKKSGDIDLRAFVQLDFEKSVFARVLSLCLEVSNSMNSQIIIGFQRYNPITEVNDVNAVLQSFSSKDYTVGNVKCIEYE